MALYQNPSVQHIIQDPEEEDNNNSNNNTCTHLHSSLQIKVFVSVDNCFITINDLSRSSCKPTNKIVHHYVSVPNIISVQSAKWKLQYLVLKGTSLARFSRITITNPVKSHRCEQWRRQDLS